MTFTFWATLGVFVLGLFIDGMLGILLMCTFALLSKPLENWQ